MRFLLLMPVSLTLVLTVGCGGGGGGASPNPAPPASTWATSLAYTDPTGSGFRLLKNAALSTPNRLVLDLAGPAGQNAQGFSFIFNADGSKVQWAPPPASIGLVQSLAFGSGGTPPVLVGKDMGGGTLQGAAFQKAGSQPMGQPLARVCLDLKANSVSPNASVSLSFTMGNMLSDVGVVSSITVAVGTCVAR